MPIINKTKAVIINLTNTNPVKIELEKNQTPQNNYASVAIKPN